MSSVHRTLEAMQYRDVEPTVDWQIPDVQMMLKGKKITLHETLKGGKGIIFGVPGAFTPVCTEKHLPGIHIFLSFV